jgi:hypothetical protein
VNYYLKAAKLPSSPRVGAPDETHAGASKSSRSGKLRLLMMEREDVASRLAELDYVIRALEEIYRREPEKMPLSQSGTLVPEGSLTNEGGKPQP